MTLTSPEAFRVKISGFGVVVAAIASSFDLRETEYWLLKRPGDGSSLSPSRNTISLKPVFTFLRMLPPFRVTHCSTARHLVPSYFTVSKSYHATAQDSLPIFRTRVDTSCASNFSHRLGFMDVPMQTQHRLVLFDGSSYRFTPGAVHDRLSSLNDRLRGILIPVQHWAGIQG